MSAAFEELAWEQTPMGVISLRRRLEPSLKIDVYEVKLDDEFLMSSLFTVAEAELARLGLAERWRVLQHRVRRELSNGTWRYLRPRTRAWRNWQTRQV